jgi:zinc finger protein 830
MSDARALLRAKRQAEESRISHPYASYTSSKQLKCNVCDVIVKHASAWEGHLGSKGHRTVLAQLRKQHEQQQQRQRELEAAAAAASLEDRVVEDEGGQGKGVPGKRKASVSGEDLEAKKRRTGSEAQGSSGGFPTDFFSDPNRQIPVSNDDDEGEEGDTMAVDSGSAQQPVAEAKTAVDEEYERFQRELMSMQEKAPAVAKHEAFARATVVAEEELFTEQQKSGFDLSGDGQEEKVEEETDEQKRERKAQEERELIMDRLLEEERLQEDCDLRVASMKARVEALKKKREMRKAAKQGKS